MKILSSYKDYYDYLVGIIGEDPILVLDRRDHQQPDFVQYLEENPIDIEDRPIMSQQDAKEVKKYQLYIGNYLVEFVVYNHKIYYGEQIKNIPHYSIIEGKTMRPYYVDSIENSYGMKFSQLVECGYFEIGFLENVYGSKRQRVNSFSILSKPVKTKRPKDLPDDIVIALGKHGANYTNIGYCGICHYPKLSDLSLGKMVKPEEVYQMIVDYLSEQKSKAEQHIDLRTNVQKIEGKGFDKKTSFRPNMK
jgi:hypothetical protein